MSGEYKVLNRVWDLSYTVSYQKRLELGMLLLVRNLP